LTMVTNKNVIGNFAAVPELEEKNLNNG